MVPPQGTIEEHTIMAKKTTEPVVELTEAEALLQKAARLDAQIKELTAELEPIKAQLKNEVPAGQTYASGAYTMKVGMALIFNARAAAALYSDVPEAHEPKITADSLKAYLNKKYAKKPAKVQEKLDAVYSPSVRIEFGSRS
jgi:hypothetical protein